MAVISLIVYYIVLPNLVKQYIWPSKIENRQLFLYIYAFSVHEFIYILCNISLFFIYKSNYKFFENFKVHDEPWPWVEDKPKFITQLKRAAKVILSNQFIIIPIFLYLNIFIFDRLKFRLDLESFPSIFEISWQMAVFILCDDFTFYWSHRFLHWGPIYPYIHKIHHEFKITIGIASEHAHPVEFLFGNIIPTSIGSALLGSRVHAFTYGLWIMKKIYNTSEGHSGYQFPWSPSTLMPFKVPSHFHNFHHLKFRGNYGGYYGFWDWLCGTTHSEYDISILKKNKEE